jgi:sigma-E factor negative regulatory protein RseC
LRQVQLKLQDKERQLAQKRGLVKQVSRDGWAMVVTERGDACGNCESAQFCHSLADCSRMETRVLNRANAAVGDRVVVSLSSTSVFTSAVILYLLPTVSLLLGAIGGSGWNEQLGIGGTLASILFGFAGLIVGFAIAGLISKSQKASRRLTPVITRIVKPTDFHATHIRTGL